MMHFNTKHGSARRSRKTPTYKTWESMIRRCTMPSQDSYPLYGGRGIVVCDRWKNFEAFLEDMGEKPDGLSIDRIDPSGNYAPGNCRWVNMKIQQRNRSNNRMITFDGKTMTAAEWSEQTGILSATIRTRIDKYGWPLEKALTIKRGRGESAKAANAARWGYDRQREALDLLSDAITPGITPPSAPRGRNAA